MNDIEWEETRREYDIDEKNEYVKKKATLEHRKKRLLGMEIDSTLDLTVKMVGVIAVFFPLLFLAYSNHKEHQEEKYKRKASLYGEIVKNYAGIFWHQSTNLSNLNSIDSVEFLITSQLELPEEDTQLFNRFEQLNANIITYSKLTRILIAIDSLKDNAEKSLQAFKNIADRPNMPSNDYHNNYRQYRNYLNLLPAFYELRDDIEKDTVYGKNLDSIKTIFADSLDFIDKEYISLVKNELTQMSDLPVNGASNLFFRPGLSSDLSKDMYKIDNNQKDSYTNEEIMRQLNTAFFKGLTNQFYQVKKEIQSTLKNKG